MSVLTFEELTKKAPEKSLTTDLRHRAGRNNQGKITVRHQRRRRRVASIVSSISRRTKDRHPRHREGHRIRSQPYLLSSPCSIMPTAKRPTSWLLWA